MNKTVTINIAGLVFHIDEDAYNKLDSYINAVRNSIQQDEKEEIIADIEARIAELFSERIDSQTGVIRMSNVDEIINIMGKPEDYIIEEETFDSKKNFQSSVNFKQPRKVYRDGDKRILGGVCAGLGHYLNVDVVWIRIIFVLLFFLYGLSTLVYFILWIIIPKARTVADVLEMKGEPVNISNIEKQFRQGISHSYQTLKTNGKSAADIIRKIIGITLIVFGAMGTFGSFFVPFAFNHQHNRMSDSMLYYNDSIWGLPFWTLSLSLFLVSCLLFVLLILLGVKIAYPKVKHIGLIAIVLGLIWAVALFFFTYGMINTNISQLKSKKTISESLEKKISQADLMLGTNDTLKLIFDKDSRIFTINDTVTNGYKYGEIDDVEVKILESTIGKAYIEIEENLFTKSSDHYFHHLSVLGKTKTTVATVKFSNTLNYNYSIKNDTLALSNAILATLNEFTEENEVKVKVFITPEQTVKISGRDEDYIEDVDLEPGTNYYRFNRGKLKYINNDIIN